MKLPGCLGSITWPGLLWTRLKGSLTRRADQGRLETEAVCYLPLLPVLRAQLRETARQIEDAVVEVGRDFAGMATRARQSVAQAGELVGEGHGQAGMHALLDASQQTLHSLLERIIRGSELSARTIQRMDEVRSAMRQIIRQSEAIDRISYQNRIVALNAKIEAVHVGEQGAGFGVVADEITGQAQRSQEIAETIASLVRSMRGEVESAVSDLHEMASADMQKVELSRREVDSVVEGLRNAHEAMQQVLADSARRSKEVAEEISRAVTALQFQDRASQRIAHVLESLEAMEAALSAPVEELLKNPPPALEKRRREIMDRLDGGYTMAAERQVHAALVGSACGGGSGDDVELF